MPLEPNAKNATGLLGWRHYAAADRGTDILDDMSRPPNGSSGFGGALPAGDYTVWIQELAPGEFNYRFNFLLSPVPEAPTAMLLLAVDGGAQRRLRRSSDAALSVAAA